MSALFWFVSMGATLLIAFAYHVFSLAESDFDKRLALASMAIVLGCMIGNGPSAWEHLN